jgi:hypothetical protein
MSPMLLFNVFHYIWHISLDDRKIILAILSGLSLIVEILQGFLEQYLLSKLKHRCWQLLLALYKRLECFLVYS